MRHFMKLLQINGKFFLNILVIILKNTNLFIVYHKVIGGLNGRVCKHK